MKIVCKQFITPLVLVCIPALYAQDSAQDEVAIDGTPEYIQQGEDDGAMPEVPEMFRDDALLDESHSNRELGINVYTAPSISKIFNQLEKLPSIPEEYVLRNRSAKISTASGKVALEMGFLLADGFIAVCSGHMNDVKPIAMELNRYGRMLGVGDKMDIHSAALLEQAEKGNRKEFKRILNSTQSDVNAELAGLGDPDLAHLIALGGWVRACEASAAALCEEFSAEQASIIFYPDAPAYFREILLGTDPETAKKLEIKEMSELLQKLTELMTLQEGDTPTPEKVEQLRQIAGELAARIVGEDYAH